MHWKYVIIKKATLYFNLLSVGVSDLMDQLSASWFTRIDPLFSFNGRNYKGACGGGGEEVAGCKVGETQSSLAQRLFHISHACLVAMETWWFQSEISSEVSRGGGGGGNGRAMDGRGCCGQKANVTFQFMRTGLMQDRNTEPLMHNGDILQLFFFFFCCVLCHLLCSNVLSPCEATGWWHFKSNLY